MSRLDHYAQGTPSYVELTTPDQQAAKAFYGPLFGWEFDDVEMGEAGTYVTVSVQGDAVAGITGQMPQLAGHPAFWGVYLAVEDVDSTAAAVAPAGGRVEAGPFDVMELGRMASIRDPTGVRVNLWQAGQSIGSVRVNEPGCPIWHELTSPDLPTATTFYADVLGVAWESVPTVSGDDYTCLMVDGRPVGGASRRRWRASRRTGRSTSTSSTRTPPRPRPPPSAARCSRSRGTSSVSGGWRC
jgi:predicted enzyme related to lactoylglutathione lyase